MARHKNRNLAYIAKRGLVETRDPEIDRAICASRVFPGSRRLLIWKPLSAGPRAQNASSES